MAAYLCNDGEGATRIKAATAEDAAHEYVSGGDWGELSTTTWIDVHVAELNADGDPVDDGEWITVAVDPEEPACSSPDGHDWQSPYEVLGGLRENPGVFGKGGGVIITEVCAHCGCYRRTDTWATNPDTGEQGLRSLEYREADDKSREWLHRSSLEAREEN